MTSLHPVSVLCTDPVIYCICMHAFWAFRSTSRQGFRRCCQWFPYQRFFLRVTSSILHQCAHLGLFPPCCVHLAFAHCALGARPMPEHHRSSEAIYHPIPQAPVASNAIPTASPEVDLDDEAILSGSSMQESVVDSRISWTHFMLGCAVLLPWNGACACRGTRRFAQDKRISSHNRNTILPTARDWNVLEEHILLIPVYHIHCSELHIPRTCHRNREEGRFSSACVPDMSQPLRLCRRRIPAVCCSIWGPLLSSPSCSLRARTCIRHQVASSPSSSSMLSGKPQRVPTSRQLWWPSLPFSGPLPCKLSCPVRPLWRSSSAACKCSVLSHPYAGPALRIRLSLYRPRNQRSSLRSCSLDCRQFSSSYVLWYIPGLFLCLRTRRLCLRPHMLPDSMRLK